MEPRDKRFLRRKANDHEKSQTLSGASVQGNKKRRTVGQLLAAWEYVTPQAPPKPHTPPEGRAAEVDMKTLEDLQKATLAELKETNRLIRSLAGNVDAFVSLLQEAEEHRTAAKQEASVEAEAPTNGFKHA